MPRNLTCEVRTHWVLQGLILWISMINLEKGRLVRENSKPLRKKQKRKKEETPVKSKALAE